MNVKNTVKYMLYLYKNESIIELDMWNEHLLTMAKPCRSLSLNVWCDLSYAIINNWPDVFQLPGFRVYD